MRRFYYLSCVFLGPVFSYIFFIRKGRNPFICHSLCQMISEVLVSHLRTTAVVDSTYCGSVLMAVQLLQHMFPVRWTHCDLGETTESLRHRIQLTTHLTTYINQLT